MGDISHSQVLLSVQLKDTLLNSLRGETGKLHELSKMMQEITQKHYFPSIANHIRKWIRQCQICVQNKRIDNSQIKAELISIPDWDLGPEDVL